MKALLLATRILVTRPRDRSRAWIEAFESAGATVVHLPVMELAAVSAEEQKQARHALVTAAARGDGWLAFTSVTGVEKLAAILSADEHGAVLEQFSVASVGAETTRAIEEQGWTLALEAPQPRAQALGRAILDRAAKPFVLHPTAAVALPHLRECVDGEGGSYSQVIVYAQQPLPAPSKAELTQALAALDLATFASPSAVHGVLRWIEESGGHEAPSLSTALRNLPALAIGSTTEDALIESGFAHHARCERPDVAAVLAGVKELLGITP